MVGFKLSDMKNNLLALKSSNIDAQLPTRNDFLQLVITNKMEGEFVDLLEEVKDILERDYMYEDEDDELMDESGPFYFEKLKGELPEETALDFNSNSLLYAGYSDCMEEAIRFLTEEEKISPEHPIVKNLKAHLEKSKDRILQMYSGPEENVEIWKTRFGGDVGNDLSDTFFETFQNCRDSG